MKTLFILACIAATFLGCATSNPSFASPKIQDCLRAQFFTAETENGVVARRYRDNTIYAVRTPTDRLECFGHQFSISAFAKLIGDPRKAEEQQVPKVNLPSMECWKQLRPCLKPDDQIWTLAGLDWGFVVLRSGHLFCLIITDHSL